MGQSQSHACPHGGGGKCRGSDMVEARANKSRFPPYETPPPSAHAGREDCAIVAETCG